MNIFHGAKWISEGAPLQNELDYYEEKPAAIFQKTFSIGKTIKKATLRIVGLGYYAAEINGIPVTKSVLNPDWSNFDKLIYYDSYEVTKLLSFGSNKLTAELGNGWYNSAPMKLFERYNLRDYLATGEKKLLACLSILYADGDGEEIVTDERWQWSEGQWLFDNIYLGEHVDYSRSAGQLQPVSLAAAPAGKLEKSFLEKIYPGKRVQPKAIRINAAGNLLIDFGETLAGFVDVTFSSQRGRRITLGYAENIQADGSPDYDSVAAGFIGRVIDGHLVQGGEASPKFAGQQDVVVTSEGTTRFTNRFCWHSFRYIELCGCSRQELEKISVYYVHTQLKEAGSFHAGQPFFERLHEAFLTTRLNNVHSVIADCARERFAYGGDILCLSASQCLTWNCEHILRKTIRDFRLEQCANGGIPETAPFVGIKSNGTGEQAGPIAWQMGYPVMIGQLYRYYGRRDVLQEEYPYLVRALAHLSQLPREIRKEACLGDWGSDEAVLGERRKVSPAVEFTTECFYYGYLRLMAGFAERLGKGGDAESYTARAEAEYLYLRKAYENPDGSFADGSQTSWIFALKFRLFADGEAAMQRFRSVLQQTGGRLRLGIYGMMFFYEVMPKYGGNDLVYQWLLADGKNTYRAMLEKNGNCLSEYLYEGSFGSDNHAMFGSYEAWLMHCIAGIRVTEEACGSDAVELAPYFPEDMQEAGGSYQGPYGEVGLEWKRKGSSLELEIRKPAGLRECRLVLPKNFDVGTLKQYLISGDSRVNIYDIRGIAKNLNVGVEIL